MAADVQVLTHVAESARLADVWLESVERLHVVERFEMEETAGGWRVTAHVVAGVGGRLVDELGDQAGAGPLPASQPAVRSCACCGAVLAVQLGRGRRRRYCSDACRSRAARERHPKPPTCQLRVGGWPCDRPAVAYLREPDEARPGRFKPWGFTAACCVVCLPLVEAFAASNSNTTCRQPVEDHRAEQRARGWSAAPGDGAAGSPSR